MDSEKNDYSFWKYFKTWTLIDAWRIIEHYNYELLSGKGDDFRKETLCNYLNLFERDSKIFSYEIDWVTKNDDSGYGSFPVVNEMGEFEYIVGDQSKVHINEFIKWADTEHIPLPPAILDIVKHNWKNGELMPNSEMTENDYLALSELPELKRKVIQLEEYVQVLKHSIYAATRTPWLYLYKDIEVASSLDEFIGQFKIRHSGVPDEIIEMIYNSLPRKVKANEPEIDHE